MTTVQPPRNQILPVPIVSLPIKAVPYPRKAEPLTQEEYELIKQQIPSYKYLLLVRLLRATGLREAEVMRLCPEHLERRGPDLYLLVRRGKKRKLEYEAVAVHPEVATELLQWVQGNALRPGESLWPYKAKIFQRTFRRAAWAALGRRVTPHSLRKLYAKNLLDAGLPLAAVAKLLGHEDTRTTEQWYYDLTSDQRRLINARTRP